MAHYVNGCYVGRKASEADPFSQSQSLLGGGSDWLQLSLPVPSQLERNATAAAPLPPANTCLGVGPGGLFEGLEDSQPGGQEEQSTEQIDQAVPPPQVPQQQPQPQKQSALLTGVDLEQARIRRKLLEPFDVDQLVVRALLCCACITVYTMCLVSSNTEAASKHQEVEHPEILGALQAHWLLHYACVLAHRHLIAKLTPSYTFLRDTLSEYAGLYHTTLIPFQVLVCMLARLHIHLIEELPPPSSLVRKPSFMSTQVQATFNYLPLLVLYYPDPASWSVLKPTCSSP